ncbi:MULTISPECIES: pre-16S rRNA-processing nuclease YqgF [unclassified Leptolyngbya]|uniref:pre-16S rRNA-processing nuclease YqgF n=1 Tax=unclassified Leptolyngbya TaxID=2650499 RepID=UPI0016853301|nr:MULTISPECIES: pre-16S rRNA-processing nuclease YqgF [unclassified Leptolyngbya]MBD1912679.1 pre-16S rRNA-processing nuclease YqgF [Leptolyngbya sp. FACHB-8]MBD2154698.1 pre-16S rRNA-processing nuclease YqgF [Leptolyngbya sp. FACHB-16]
MTEANHFYILGFDPGRDKCGVAVRSAAGLIVEHQVIPAGEAIAILQTLCQRYPIAQIVLGNQTTAKQWQREVQRALPDIAIALVDERYSTLEARDRYWQMYPPQGLQKLMPQSLRQISRPIDDIVAILLIERYLQAQT